VSNETPSMDERERIIEEMRWRTQRFRFQTPEEFESTRGEPWLAKGRNHGTWTTDSPAEAHRIGVRGGLQR
jgi:hypothetical protein